MPTAVEQTLLSLSGAAVHDQLHLRPNRQLASVRLEPQRTTPASDWPDLQSRATSAMQRLGLDVAVQVVSPGTLPRSSGKAPRIVLDS